MLIAIIRDEVRKKYAGSILGVLWIFIYPALFLALYSSVYLWVFKVKLPEFSNWAYVFHIFCGLVPYIGFSDGIQQGSQSLAANANLLKNTVFPAELISVKTVLSSQVTYGFMFMVLIVFGAVTGYFPVRPWFLVMAFGAQIFFLLGVTWVLSVLMIAVKDLQYFLNLFLLFLFFSSPIAFAPEMVPAALRFLLYLNPLFYLISLYRMCFFETTGLSPVVLTLTPVVSLGVFLGGFLFFKKIKEMLFEYV